MNHNNFINKFKNFIFNIYYYIPPGYYLNNYYLYNLFILLYNYI